MMQKSKKNNNRQSLRFITSLMLMTVLTLTALIGFKAEALASDTTHFVWQNPQTGYSVYMQDDADLLSEDEENRLIAESMRQITEYCSVVFYSTNSNPYGTTATLGQEVSYDYFGYSDRGTVFIIDMDNRYLYVYSRGGIEKTITKSKADSLTDNIYKYATNAEYFLCARDAYDQMYKVLDGQRIAEPMRYISNVFISLILGFLISFLIAMHGASPKRASNSDIVDRTNHKVIVEEPNTTKIATSKVYSPPSSSSGGGGGGGHSGGGGGHSGGGGGGHGF